MAPRPLVTGASLALALVVAGHAWAGPPPLSPSRPTPVGVPQTATASGYQAAPFSLQWADARVKCLEPLVACAPGSGTACGLPSNSTVVDPYGPPQYACNFTLTSGLIGVQSCAQDNNSSNIYCSLVGAGDVSGDAALGFDLAMPTFAGYDATYETTLTADLSLRFSAAMEDSDWPWGAENGQGSIVLNVYDVGTGAVVASQAEGVYTASAYGPSKDVVVSSNGEVYLSSPLTAVISALPGHTYQVWVWATVDGTASSGITSPYWSLPYSVGNPDQFMDVNLRGVSWSVNAVPPPSSQAPTITAIAPTIGNPGTVVQITGSNFFVQYPPTVSFGGVPAAVTCYSSTSCQAIAPAGTGTVAVTADFAPSFVEAAGQFTYAGAPQCAPASTCGLEIISSTAPFQSVETVTVSCHSTPQTLQELVGDTWVSLPSFVSNASLPSSTVANVFDIGLQSSAGATTSGAPVGSVQQVRACTASNGGTVCDAPASVTIASCPVAGSSSSGPGAGGCSPRSCGTGYYWNAARCGCAKDFCACGGTYPKCTVCQ